VTGRGYEDPLWTKNCDRTEGRERDVGRVTLADKSE
jgi:hypothetical protein